MNDAQLIKIIEVTLIIAKTTEQKFFYDIFNLQR
jgi:hypothetical protein